jgi:hypothetical protein
VAKRIVINFDPSQAPAGARRPKRRRWLRILALLAIVFVAIIVVIAVVGFFSWRRYQASPEYSLTLLVDAALRSDTAELAKLMDDDEIARNMAASVNQKAVARYGGSIDVTTQQQIDKTMPALLSRLKPTIHDEVVKEIRALATTPEPKPFPVLLVLVPRLVKITTEGDLAKGASAVTTTNFQLTMRRDSDRWKLIDFNSDAVVQRVVDSVMKDLPPIGGFDSDNPLLKNLGRSRKRRR